MKLAGTDLSLYGTTETIVKTLHVVSMYMKGAKPLQPGTCHKRRGDQMAKILQQGKMMKDWFKI